MIARPRPVRTGALTVARTRALTAARTVALTVALAVTLAGTPTSTAAASPVRHDGAPVVESSTTQGEAAIERVRPRVRGLAAARETLTAVVGPVAPASARKAFQWLRDGAPVAGATARTYRLTRADVGHRIGVRVLLRADGYADSVRRSKDTARVIERPSLRDPESIWVVVNKRRPLDPIRFVPELTSVKGVQNGASARMRPDAARALRRMALAAEADGTRIAVASAYRSYSSQASLLARYTAAHGSAIAERMAARAGYSEHQTGLAVDVYDGATCRVRNCYASTRSAKWAAANAWRYGFIIRYPDGKQQITGYKYEPWHLRYVGRKLSTAMHDAKVATLEEYFGLSPAPDY